MEDITKNNNAEKKINQAADKVQSNVEQARRASVDVAEKAFTEADKAIESARNRGQQMWNRAKVKSQDLLDDVESNSRKMWSRTRNYVQDQPGQALGYAVLFGVVLGILLAPKGRE